MDKKIADSIGAKKARELQYENECRQQYENRIVEDAYVKQAEARAKATDPVAAAAIPPIVRYREWYSKVASKSDLTDALNTLESMGFQIVHVTSGLGGEYVVSGCRAVGTQIPEKVVDTGEAEPLPSVDPATEPPVVGEADEDKRREWENATD